MTPSNEFFMEIALEEAQKSFEKDEVPVGAISVLNNKIIARSHNLSINNNDPSAHAEINVIRETCKSIKNYRCPGVRIFVTLEPCAMCYSALVHSRVSEIVFGAYDFKTGVCGSCLDFSKNISFNHKPIINGGILEKKCSEILKSFFYLKRN